MIQTALYGRNWGSPVDFDVRFNAAAAVDRATEIGLFHFGGRICRFLRSAIRSAPVVIIEERPLRVIALNQAAARSVIMSDSQEERSAVCKREDVLDESFAETRFAHNQTAVVILNGAGDDL